MIDFNDVISLSTALRKLKRWNSAMFWTQCAVDAYIVMVVVLLIVNFTASFYLIPNLIGIGLALILFGALTVCTHKIEYWLGEAEGSLDRLGLVDDDESEPHGQVG